MFKHKGLSPILLALIFTLIIFTLSRIILCIWQYDVVNGYLLNIFSYGLRYDLSIFVVLFSLPTLLLIVLGYFKKITKPFKIALSIYFAFVLALIAFFEITTPPFIHEYGVRPNHIYLEYLKYPKEVFSMMASGHILESVISIVLTVVIFTLFYKLFKKVFNNYTFSSRKVITIQAIFVLLAFPFLQRGTLTHKPLNPSNAAFTDSQTANSLPVNSAFNLFYTARHLGENEVKRSEIYALSDNATTLSKINELSAATFTNNDEQCKINQIITPSKTPTKPKNVVLIFMESFGSQFVGSLGGINLSPNIDKLSKEGWLFTRMYAIGHRSVRGIEAVTASNPPSPLPSIVKLPHANKLSSLSMIFNKLGYDTSFIYGGESHFDNMRTFFFNSGVKHIIEQKDYKDPEYTSSWGVSDEDLFNEAHKYFEETYKKNTPFCSVVFTSSLHDPFDIPEGKVNIDGIKSNDVKRHMAVKYADYAIGKFFEKAKASDYYKDTIFAVIADHDSRAKDYKNFPLKNFSIPALIISSDLAPRIDNRIVSQIDVLPTVLSLAGVQGEFPITGQDLTKENIKQRAPIIYYYDYGYLSLENGEETFTILKPSTTPISFNVGDKNTLTDKKETKNLLNKITFENLAISIYKHAYNKASCIKNPKLMIAK